MELCADYEGEWAHGRYSGPGVFSNEKGKYVGEFENFQFHGEGTFYCPTNKGGGRWEGTWENGVMVEGKFIFEDDLVYEDKNWAYGTKTDPRFTKEIKEGVSPQGPLKYHMAKQENLDRLPEGCFDTIDGYLDPKSFIIREYGTGNELRRPTQQEREWTIANARVGDVPLE